MVMLIDIAGSYKSREDFILTHDIEKEISADSPVHHRTKAIKELSDAVLNQQWEDVCMRNYIVILLKIHCTSIIEAGQDFLYLIFAITDNRKQQNVCGV